MPGYGRPFTGEILIAAPESNSQAGLIAAKKKKPRLY